MPIYEYRCLECKKKFERIVLSAEAARKVACPGCGGARVDKLVSRFATSPKGSADDFGDLGGGDDEFGGEDFGGGYPGGAGGEPDDDEGGAWGSGDSAEDID